MYPYTFKLQSPPKYFQFDTIHLSRLFFHCSEQFLEVSILKPFSASAIFVSPLPLWQNVFFWGLFSFGETKNKVARDKIRWLGRVGREGYTVFGQNLLNTQHGIGRCAEMWNGQTCCKSLQENTLELNTASHNNTSWYTDTDGFLEHSPSRGSLYYKGPSRR